MGPDPRWYSDVEYALVFLSLQTFSSVNNGFAVPSNRRFRIQSKYIRPGTVHPNRYPAGSNQKEVGINKNGMPKTGPVAILRTAAPGGILPGEGSRGGKKSHENHQIL